MYSKCFKRDEHIPDLLAFHPNARFTEDPIYLSGKIILQDKASCFPAHILAPPARDDVVVIDATAAPGNKTSHLSAIMQSKGKVSLALMGYPSTVTKDRSADLGVVRLRARPQAVLDPQEHAIQSALHQR